MIRTAAAYVRDSRLKENPRRDIREAKEAERGLSLIRARCPGVTSISDRPRIIPAPTRSRVSRVGTSRGAGTTL